MDQTFSKSNLQFSPFTGNVFAGRSYADQGRSLPERKAVSPEMSAWLRAEDVDPSEQGAKLVSPYSQSAWVYVAVSRMAEKIASIPFRISNLNDGDARRFRAVRNSRDPQHRNWSRRILGESIVEGGAVVDLFDQPHPTMNSALFWEMVVTWNCLRGEFFIVPLDLSDSPVDLKESAPRVDRLITLPTELFWHIVTGYELTAWRYTGSPLLTPIPSEILSPGEVIHCRMVNPYLYWRGMSPLIVAMLAAGADYAAAQYSKGYWLNNADTGVIVTTDQQLTPEQRAQILAALRERKRKAGTADRPLLLSGGAKVDKPQLSGMEQQFIDNRRMNRQEIGAIFKVPEVVMGFSSDKSSALSGGGNAINQEILNWIENTVSPLCGRLENAVLPVIRTFGPNLFGWFDIESLPVMQEARRARLDAGVKAFGIGATFNDINRVYDLGFPEYGWGDKSFLPFSIQEVGADGLPENELPGEDDPQDQAKSNPFARMQKLLSTLGQETPAVRAPDTKILWQSHIATRRKKVKLFEAKVGKVLNTFRTATLAKLDEIHLGKTIEQRSLVDLIFDPHKFGHSLVVELTNPILDTLQTAGNELHQEIGKDDPWTMPPEKARAFLAQRQQPIAGAADTVRTQLNTTLQQGIDAGETTAQLSERVRAVYNHLAGFEARRIALTEVNIAYNSARHDAMTDAGIGYKAWLSSHGPNVRPAHAAAELTYIGTPIPVDEPFKVGGEDLMFPGDDSLGASPGNVINCQCIQLAAQKTGEDDNSTSYKVFGVGALRFARSANQQPEHRCT